MLTAGFFLLQESILVTVATVFFRLNTPDENLIHARNNIYKS